MSDQYIARSPKIAARKLGDEMIVMSAVDSSLFTLNEVATAIWQSADGHTPLDAIVAKNVCEQFEVSESEAMRDAEEFVKQLSAHGILMVSDQPIETHHPSNSKPELPGTPIGGARWAARGGSAPDSISPSSACSIPI